MNLKENKENTQYRTCVKCHFWK